MMKYIERIYPWLLGAPIILPVVIWGGLIYPYLVPKTLLFYAIILVTAGAFAILATHGRAFFYARLGKWETWIPAALLVLAYTASWVGIDFYRSFWSLFVRGDGLLMLTCAVASFYLVLLYADWVFFKWLLRAIAAVATFVAVYGIGEWILGGGRIGSLLGNAAFFAGYLDIAFFATLAAAQMLSRAWKRAAIFGAVLQVVAIVLTATRGTILALIVAGIAYLAFLALRGEGTQRAWSVGILGTVIVLGGIFFAFRSELAKAPFAPVARVASISITDPDIANRLFIWKNMVGEIEKSPVLGVGAEHIDVLFNRFYDPTQISEQWFDRSHNAFLDYAAQYGIGGLLLYFALIATFFIAAARLWRRGERRIAGIFALLALSYAVQNFFIFDTISSFWLLLALLSVFLAMSFKDEPRATFVVPVWTRRAAWPFACVLLILIIPASIRPAFAAYDLSAAYLYQLVDIPREISYLSHGIALGTYGDVEYGYEAYDMYANNQVSALAGQARMDAYQATLSILTANFKRYPYDARTALCLAHVLSLAPPGVTVDSALLSSALERAIRLSPKRYQPWYILANLSLSEANTYPAGSAQRIAGYAAAQDILTRYIALVPNLSEPHFVLAQLLFASGDTAGAAVEAAKGKADYQGDLETARRAASYYENALNLPDAAFFLAEVVRLDPSNTAAASDLAKIQAYEQSKK
ncbi:MAG: O-antigen ligase family protein [Minisyncoccia bacterium]|jgi:O-antigen ligase